MISQPSVELTSDLISSGFEGEFKIIETKKITITKNWIRASI